MEEEQLHMDLVDTVEFMLNDDYKSRFKAEYLQLSIRIDRLQELCDKWDNEELDFEPTCDRIMLEEQLTYMRAYLEVLKKRAEMEEIEL